MTSGGTRGTGGGPDQSTCRRFSIKSPSIVDRRIGPERILVPICQKADEVDSIYALNEMAGRIWELIDGRAMQISSAPSWRSSM